MGLSKAEVKRRGGYNRDPDGNLYPSQTPKSHAEKVRSMPIEYQIYRKWREKARLDGLEVAELKTGRDVLEINMKNPEYLEFLKLFDELDKDEDGNYLCPIHRNRHPMVKPSYEWVTKERSEGRNGQHDDSPSCDRVHNHLPHALDNCQIICWRMNNGKGYLSLEECEDLGYWAEGRQIDESEGYY